MGTEAEGTSGLVFNEPLIFEKSRPGCIGYSLPSPDVPKEDLEQLFPKKVIREDIAEFPEVSEVEVVRHFTRLSQWNYSIDYGLFPLGSCTMKYNPKIHEDLARLPAFALSHPYQPPELSQGLLHLIYDLQSYLAEITGMDHFTLQPAAGAQGELTGLMMIRAYHEARGEKRRKVLLPHSAHGTNPASSTLCGYQVVEINTDPRGNIDLKALENSVDEDVAALMLTNPNTLGLFEEYMLQIAELVHSRGGLIYFDGANMNALLGIARPGDMGADVIQLNLHKTFSTPHGGGGPGAGPVGIKNILEPFLPLPVLQKEKGGYFWDYNRPQSIGKVHAFYGNFGVLVKAYAYIRSLGAEGLKKISQTAVLNANYIRQKLKDYYYLPYDRPCMHECVFSDKWQNKYGINTLDIAKRLMDYGYHPPTIYFPLIVKGALMIEPCESESKYSLDKFIEALRAIASEAQDNPDLIRQAPTKTFRARLDETRANRMPQLRWQRKNSPQPQQKA
jgi:glycine dehydrogenase subunit 2